MDSSASSNSIVLPLPNAEGMVQCTHREWSAKQNRFRECHTRFPIAKQTQDGLCPHHIRELKKLRERPKQEQNSAKKPRASESSSKLDKLVIDPQEKEEDEEAQEEGHDDANDAVCHSSPFTQLPPDHAKRLLLILVGLHKLLSPLPLQEIKHKSFEKLYVGPIAKKKEKHVLQESSILGHMDRASILPDLSTTTRSCFVEFGAGTATFSRHLQRTIQSIETGISSSSSGAASSSSPAVPPSSMLSFVMIDRMAFNSRSKKDYMLRMDGFNVRRLQQDIQSIDVRLACPLASTFTFPKGLFSELIIIISSILGAQIYSIPEFQTAKSIIGVCKHFCGEATDIALRFMVDVMNGRREEKEEKFLEEGSKIAMATCCHHLCNYENFCSIECLAEVVDEQKSSSSHREEADGQFVMQRPQLEVIFKLTSWATINVEKEDEFEPLESIDVAEAELDPSVLNRRQRREIGRRCKLLLDLSRMRFLQKAGYQDLEIVRYTSLSAEDRLLLGKMH